MVYMQAFSQCMHGATHTARQADVHHDPCTGQHTQPGRQTCITTHAWGNTHSQAGRRASGPSNTHSHASRPMHGATHTARQADVHHDPATHTARQADVHHDPCTGKHTQPGRQTCITTHARGNTHTQPGRRASRPMHGATHTHSQADVASRPMHGATHTHSQADVHHDPCTGQHTHTARQTWHHDPCTGQHTQPGRQTWHHDPCTGQHTQPGRQTCITTHARGNTHSQAGRRASRPMHGATHTARQMTQHIQPRARRQTCTTLPAHDDHCVRDYACCLADGCNLITSVLSYGGWVVSVC